MYILLIPAVPITWEMPQTPKASLPSLSMLERLPEFSILVSNWTQCFIHLKGKSLFWRPFPLPKWAPPLQSNTH